ncbi:Chitin synthase, class 1 [Coemansia sp. RSA 1797]|nr:Chitin synthase, class 1 [Coemansia sp. RSA 1797]
MVDADTKVHDESLRLLVNCMNNDQLIMGLCGETKIANKRDSWVTAIQVFEYYISHHLSKAFESVFGGVTCLPGCFCMYRLKARKGDDWVPVLTKPEICQEYSQNVVETLHEKNLLLLGEDRFLTTLMLRNFPSRKMMFMPQAVCKTLVPDEFKVLLSQRRRWINSTVHNLMELVLVRNLCGTFCLSMQFSIFLDLVGTVALPVAIVLTYILIVRACMTNYNSVSAFLPLAMLILVLFLPGILILITTRKWVYVLWMFVYLLALPIWNFVLPVYAYWHFDDFSWGETRKVHGETKDAGHGDSGGTFDASTVPLKRWEDYERKRLRSIRRKERKDDDSSSYQMPIVDDSANAGLLKNSVEESAYYESHPGYSFMADTSAGGSSGTLGNMHPPQQFELQSYPSMGGDSVYAAEGDPYGAGHGYPTQQQQYGAYDDYSQQQGAYGYEGHEQQQPSRQRPGGPRDYQ